MLECNIGDVYGQRTIIGDPYRHYYPSGVYHVFVPVRCSCGREDNVSLYLLQKGEADRCRVCAGTFKDNVSQKSWYNTWANMIDRCENVDNKRYADYGGRGISVCDEWHDSSSFGYWAEANGYEHGLQIDRIDNNGNYCPENCRFVTNRENALNRRNNVYGIIGNELLPMRKWCERYGINYEVMRSYKRRKNLSWEDAFFLALGRKTCKEYQYDT